MYPLTLRRKRISAASNQVIKINSKIKNMRGFKKGYQSRTNVVKVIDSYSILPRWRNHFFLLLNVHRVIDVRQTEILRAEPLMPESSAFEVEMAIEKPKGHESKGIDQIPAELIKEGCRTIRSEICKCVNYIWNKVELSEGWKESIVVPVYSRGDKTYFNNYRGISLLSTAVKVNSACRGNDWGSLWISM